LIFDISAKYAVTIVVVETFKLSIASVVIGS